MTLLSKDKFRIPTTRGEKGEFFPSMTHFIPRRRRENLPKRWFSSEDKNEYPINLFYSR